MEKIFKGILWGLGISIVLILCVGVAISTSTYRITVQPDIYTVRLDPKDPIYKASSLLIEKAWLAKFGDCERTVVMYNLSRLISLNTELSERISKIELRIEPNEPNEPRAEPNTTE